MSDKTSNLRIRVEPELHSRFLDACKRSGVPASQVIRQYMRLFVDQHQDSTQQDLFNKNKK